MNESISKPVGEADQPAYLQSRPLKVLGARNHFTNFCIDRGQRNAKFTIRPLDRPRRWFKSYNNLAFTMALGWGHDLLHTINAVPLVSLKPFVVTFEGNMPRIWGDPKQQAMRQRLWRRLCGRRCKAMIGMSAYGVGEWKHHQLGAPGFDVALSKVEQIYPTTSISGKDPKKLNETLRLCFVGRDFMRKGMPVVLRAHAALRKLGIPVETTIVSSLSWSGSDYIGPSAAYDIESEKARLTQEGVTFVPSMKNDEVLALMGNSHFSCCPSLHDTFGFSVIESLASGTPAIVSDTCAMPEMVDDNRCGYLLPLENDALLGRWIGTFHRQEPDYDDRFRSAVDAMALVMTRKLATCWENRKDYERLSAGALEQAGAKFNPITARDRLEAIYERCRS